MDEHVGLDCVEADITILVTDCPALNHRIGDISSGTVANGDSAMLLVAGAEAIGPPVNSLKDEILSLGGQRPPEIEQPPLGVILREIALAWRRAWRDEIIN